MSCKHCCYMKRNARQCRGSTLIIVLFVSVVLGLFALSLTYRSAIVLRAARQRAITMKLQAQADSAAVIAMSRLANNTNDFDHPAEPWKPHVPLAQEGWLVDWSQMDGEGNTVYSVDYEVIDAEGRLHVLLASSESLEKLGMNEDQIACLFDYMDEDSFARPGGAENRYYQSLRTPRQCKNAPLETLDELLAIKGFSPRNYWRLVREADEEHPPGWINFLTCCGDGRVNINTAPRSVLNTLGISEGAVDQVDAFRRFDKDSSGTIEEHVFTSPEDIQQLQGLSEPDSQALVARAVFRSSHFRIIVKVRHMQTGLAYALDVLVKSVDGTNEVLHWRRAI